MKNKQEIPDLIVSVESRKGGVGKTTAALCLARLLLKKGYAVLVLDLDVTGTNASDIAKSPFWKNYLNIIHERNDKYYYENKNRKQLIFMPSWCTHGAW